ncbi:MAG: hypothetical protein ACLP19_24875 [Xanthobacteraceae bacterium]
MRTFFLTALVLTAVAAAAVLLSVMAAREADAAIPFGAQFGAGSAFHIQKVTNVCGVNGCFRVQTQRVIHHQKAGNFPARHN